MISAAVNMMMLLLLLTVMIVMRMLMVANGLRLAVLERAAACRVQTLVEQSAGGHVRGC